jgi:sugar phosphate isomerase/epimerase
MKALKEINYDGWLIVELWHPRLEGAIEVGRAGLKNTRKLLETS